MSSKDKKKKEYHSVGIPRDLIKKINFLREHFKQIRGVEGFKGYKYRTHSEYIIEAIRNSVKKDIKILYYAQKMFQEKKRK